MSDAVPLAFAERGDGETLLFVHGFPLDRTMWSAQLGALGEGWRCIAPDLRGIGDSPAAAPYSMDGYADDLAALLDRLGVALATVVGLSMGGYVALALWRRHRACVRSLVLAHTRATADTDETRARRRQLIALARAEGSAAVADAQLVGLLGKSTRERRPELAAGLRARMARTAPAGIVGALEAMMARPDSTDTLATIDVPTLLVAGDEDVITPAKEMRAMAERIAGARLEVIGQSGHLSPIERPAAFNAVVREHLAALD